MLPISLPFALVAVLAGSANWYPLSIPGDESTRYEDLWFLDPQEGWAVSNKGEVWHTGDGGASWELQLADDTNYYRSCGFADDQKGWVGTFDSSRLLLETLDGGVTWTDITSRIPLPRPTGICGFTVVDENVAYGAGVWGGPFARVIKTVDGGATWETFDLDDLVGGIVDIRFTSPTDGLVSGCTPDHNAAIYGTTDGGETWELRHASLFSGIVWKMHFPSELVGYGSIEVGPFFVKTTDGGLTWSDVPYLGERWQQGIGFATDLIGWNGGRGAALPELNTYVTTDGGNTWENDPFGFNINRFQFFSPELGYAGGSVVYKYATQPPVDVAQVGQPVRLTRGRPNPFRPMTTIEYTLERADDVHVDVYDAGGRHLRSLVDAHVRSGAHAIEWDGQADDGRDVAPGVYIYVIRSASMNAMGKLVRVN